MNRQEADRVNIGDRIEVDGFTHSAFRFVNPVEVKAILRRRLDDNSWKNQCQTGIMFTVPDNRGDLHTLDAGWFKCPQSVPKKVSSV